MFQVDRAHHDDLEEILQIADARRQQYVEYQPRFGAPLKVLWTQLTIALEWWLGAL